MKKSKDFIMNLINLFDGAREEVEDSKIYDSHFLTVYSPRSRAHDPLSQ